MATQEAPWPGHRWKQLSSKNLARDTRTERQNNSQSGPCGPNPHQNKISQVRPGSKLGKAGTGSIGPTRSQEEPTSFLPTLSFLFGTQENWILCSNTTTSLRFCVGTQQQEFVLCSHTTTSLRFCVGTQQQEFVLCSHTTTSLRFCVGTQQQEFVLCSHTTTSPRFCVGTQQILELLCWWPTTWPQFVLGTTSNQQKSKQFVSPSVVVSHKSCT